MDLPKPRPYQQEIIDSARRDGNTMVILPTGTGKTLIAFYLMRDVERALMMAPTKPLVEQHYRGFSSYVQGAVLITGEIPQKKREPLYASKYVFATPQTIARDVEKGALDINSFDLVVFDECHRAVGDYAYAKIGKLLERPKVLGLTASPGGSKDRILEVVENLKIENIEIRTEEDLGQFLAEKEFKKVFVALPPEMLSIRASLKQMVDDYRERFKKLGIPAPLRKSDLIALGNRIMKMRGGSKFALIPLYVGLLHLQHCLELLETQGVSAFLKYAQNLINESKPSVRSLITDHRFLEAVREARALEEKGFVHPKMRKLLELLKTLEGKQAIVFVQYTDQINHLVSFLKSNGIKAYPFMGKKHGFDKKKQKLVMDHFRAGHFDVLVSSSIGEEGIDVPSVDAVIFYEPVPSEIRSIQRKGRTGRVRAGNVIILITKGTRDEAYFYASSKKERKMKSIIEQIRKDLSRVVRKKARESPRKEVLEKPESLETKARSLKEWL